MSKKRRRGRRRRIHPIKAIFTEGENAVGHLGAAAKGGWAATKGFIKPKQGKYDDSGKYSQTDY
jgi:hypothetical protein